MEVGPGDRQTVRRWKEGDRNGNQRGYQAPAPLVGSLKGENHTTMPCGLSWKYSSTGWLLVVDVGQIDKEQKQWRRRRGSIRRPGGNEYSCGA